MKLVLLLAALGAREQFESQVRPVLAQQCWGCHNATAMGGLRLDSRAGILRGGKSGPALAPGKPEDSLLMQAVTHRHPRLRMPPQGKLTEAQIAALAEWVKGGAVWPEEVFWAFQPVQPPQAGGIDDLVRARLARERLRQAPPADRRTLIRRATFDLTGLPPTHEETQAFQRDRSPDALAKVVDRLLASPRYGERWGRYWLDVARYSDDSFNSTQDEPYPNSFRYRDWVIQAFNDDLPYHLFVKAQIAGDHMGPEYAAGLGFYALSPEMQDDRVDATTRAFLGLTAGCAQCHDHKYDPIPTQDFYSLQGVFSSTKLHEWPLAPPDAVEAWQARKKALDKAQERLDKFYEAQRDQLAEAFAHQTARYLLAARGLAEGEGLDDETLARWRAYLTDSGKNHPFLKPWFAAKSADELRQAALEFERRVVSVYEEKKEIDEKNKITLGLNPDRGKVADASLVSLDRDQYMLYRDLFEKGSKDSAGFFKSDDGVYYYGRGKIERFLHGPWKTHLAELGQDHERLKKELPEKYPYLQIVADKEKPEDLRVHIRGDRNNLGETAPRRFLAVLSHGERKPFTKGSGRLELAEAIVAANNPLTARVMANRVWQHHFGRGIVATANNFGQNGERPSHPELLDYLADRLARNWSIKALHREIMLSATYALSAGHDPRSAAKDPENRLLWRANRRRLDAEALRDAVLFVSGTLDVAMGGKAAPLDENNRRRTVYGFVSRRKLDGMLALFDFPNPNSTSEARLATNVPLQRLYLMNSTFVERQALALAGSLSGDEGAKVTAAYRRLFQREPDRRELSLALAYLEKSSWPSFARALLTSNEFLFVD